MPAHPALRSCVSILTAILAVFCPDHARAAGPSDAGLPSAGTDLHEALGLGELAESLPSVLVEVSVLDVLLWQWIALLGLVLLVWVLSWMLATILVRVSFRVLGGSRANLDEHLLAVAKGPLRLAFAVVAFTAGSRALFLAASVQALVDRVGRLGVLVAICWLLLRLVDAFAAAVAADLRRRGQAGTAAVVPLGQRGAKAAVVVLTALAVLQDFGFNVTGVLAGLGVGGLAVALAAQKTVENLFGGLTLIADQPVRVGDFGRFGPHMGIVEEIGLRSTRIRTLDRTVVSIPNAEFSAMHIENFARRDRIWLKTTIGVRYETTPDQLRWLLVELKKMLVAHPRVDSDPARVRFVGFGAYSLDIEIFAYVLTADNNEFLAVREDMFLRIMDIVAASGTGFAFPSQTLYAASDDGIDSGRAEAASAAVEAWRGEGRMPLPWMPESMTRELAGTLDYPPRGAASVR